MILGACFAAPPAAQAHAVGLACKVLDTSVRVEAFFSDDTPAIDARIIVRNEANEIVAEGRSDERGIWTFARPASAATYDVTVDAGAGHRATQKLMIPASEAAAASHENAASESPTREEFTRTPWLKLAIGLGIIFALAAGWTARARRRRCTASPS